MNTTRVDFSSLEWTSPMPGVRFKAFRQGSRQLRMVEFSKGFVEPDWCLKGHIGYVLEGQAELMLDTGKIAYSAGDGVFIPPGPEHKHKLNVLSPVFTVVLVEDC